MTTLIQLLDRIFSIGISFDPRSQSSRKIYLTNQIALIFALSALPYFAIFNLLGSALLSWVALPSSASFFLVIYLNAVKKPTLAKLWLIISIISPVFFYASSLGRDSGIQYIFFGVLIVSNVVFESRLRLYSYVASLLPLIGFLLLEISDYTFFTPILLPTIGLQVVRFTIIGVTFLIIYLSFQFYANAREVAESALIDSRKSLEDALIDLKSSYNREKVLSSQAAFGDLVKGISHEIKNVFGILSNSAETILVEPTSEKDLKFYCETMLRNIKRLQRLVDSLLKKSSGTTEEKYFMLNMLLDDLVTLSSYQAKLSRITIETDSPLDVCLYGDRVLLYQALLNLMVNAIKHTPEHGKITISSKRITGEQELVEIAISDTGSGIPKEVLPNIFTPKFTTDPNNNTGLGLAFVYKTVTEFDGTITVDSSKRHGTTFTLRIPTY